MNLKTINDTVLIYNSMLNDPLLHPFIKRELSLVRDTVVKANIKVRMNNELLEGTIIGFFIMFNEVRFSVIDKSNLYHANWKELTLV